MQKKKNLFNFYGIELVFTRAALGAIATQALTLNTGVRALTRIVNDCLRNIEFQLPELSEAGICQITITEETLENGKPLFEYTSQLETQSTQMLDSY